jgi:hypothetical protein
VGRQSVALAASLIELYFVLVVIQNTGLNLGIELIPYLKILYPLSILL